MRKALSPMLVMIRQCSVARRVWRHAPPCKKARVRQATNGLILPDRTQSSTLEPAPVDAAAPLAALGHKPIYS